MYNQSLCWLLYELNKNVNFYNKAFLITHRTLECDLVRDQVYEPKTKEEKE